MDWLLIVKAFCVSVSAVVIIGGVVWFGIILVGALDEINDKLGILVKLSRGTPIPEADNNENDNTKDKSVDKSNDCYDTAY